VKFQSLTRYAFGLVSAFLLASCGGGGAETKVIDVGPLTVNPPAATWYAGVKNTLTISGGSAPFTISVSEPGIFPMPLVTNSRSIDIVPLQPGVVDAGLQPDELQVRTVNITVRSGEGNQATSSIKVAQNFLTGYGMFVPNSTCVGGGNIICTGGESVLLFDSTFNGALYAGHQFRIERVSGPFQFIDPLNSNNQVDAVTVTADGEGKFTTRIRVASGAPNQVALIKVTDIPTGAYTYRTLAIVLSPPTGSLAIVPTNGIRLTGPNGTLCGFGSVDVLVFDGQAPYTAFCPNPQIQVANPTSGSQPGKITFNVGASSVCLAAEECVIQDATGSRIIVPVTTEKGTDPPVTPLSVSPTTITLGCNQTGSVTVIGGSGNYSANSSHARVVATVNGNTVSITRLIGDGAVNFPTTGNVTITDGATISSVAVTTVANCP
jgi:hypothetical protein